MVKDEEDWDGLYLQTTKLNSLAKLFKPFNRDWAPLIDLTMNNKVQHAANALSFVNEIKLYFLLTRFCESSENLHMR